MDIAIDRLQSATHVVFVGPSLSPKFPPPCPERLVLRPVGRGDLDAVLRSCPKLTSIGIVDGQFMHGFAISSKEILRGIDAGKKVFGASSMGALRATELAIYGMVGVGEIFNLYASKVIDAEDEVAMTFNPETLEATSEPLVNIRIALSRACSEKRLAESVAETALRAAKSLYYPERTYRNMLAAVKGQLSAADHRSLVVACENRTSAKEEDALSMLEAMHW